MDDQDPPMTQDRLMTHVRYAVDGYVLGKWSLWQAGAQICESLETYYAAHPEALKGAL